MSNLHRVAVVQACSTLFDIARGRFDLDVAGHYARPDVFQLLVDERVKTATLSKQL